MIVIDFVKAIEGTQFVVPDFNNVRFDSSLILNNGSVFLKLVPLDRSCLTRSLMDSLLKLKADTQLGVMLAEKAFSYVQTVRRDRETAIVTIHGTSYTY